MYINSNKKDNATIEKVLQGDYRVIFVCVEMLESPTFSRILYSPLVRARLLGIFLDEAQNVHESAHWRGPYARLAGLRKAISKDLDIPLIAISATLPSLYRASLCYYAGLKKNYFLINLGNFRPELSLVVVPMVYDAASFQDLAFVLPTGCKLEDVEKTLIYCDDIKTLTEMYWWFSRRLEAMGLSAQLVDLLHAGLSQEHQSLSLADFRTSKSLIFLATEKIGAGVHVPRVRRVIMFGTKGDPTPAKVDQRRGRGARDKGITAIGYVFYEPELTTEAGREKARATMDPGMMELICTDRCHQAVLDKWLENPPRSPNPLHLCCSNCHPHLRPAREFRFVMHSFAPSAEAIPVPKKDRAAVFDELCRLRVEKWRDDWRFRWPHFSPQTLLADEDLEAVSRIARSIITLDDLRPHVKIVYWSDIAPWLLDTLHAVVDKVWPEDKSATV